MNQNLTSGENFVRKPQKNLGRLRKEVLTYSLNISRQEMQEKDPPKLVSNRLQNRKIFNKRKNILQNRKKIKRKDF